MSSCDRVKEVAYRSVRRAKTSLAAVLLYCQNRGRFHPVRALKTFGESRCMAADTLHLSIAWRRVVNVKPRPRYFL